jgi:hypothetical protein
VYEGAYGYREGTSEIEWALEEFGLDRPTGKSAPHRTLATTRKEVKEEHTFFAPILKMSKFPVNNRNMLGFQG